MLQTARPQPIFATPRPSSTPVGVDFGGARGGELALRNPVGALAAPVYQGELLSPIPPTPTRPTPPPVIDADWAPVNEPSPYSTPRSAPQPSRAPPPSPAFSPREAALGIGLGLATGSGLGQSIGGTLGGLAGAAIGGLAGGIGAPVGGIIGAFIGDALGQAVDRAFNPGLGADSPSPFPFRVDVPAVMYSDGTYRVDAYFTVTPLPSGESQSGIGGGGQSDGLGVGAVLDNAVQTYIYTNQNVRSTAYFVIVEIAPGTKPLPQPLPSSDPSPPSFFSPYSEPSPYSFQPPGTEPLPYPLPYPLPTPSPSPSPSPNPFPNPNPSPSPNPNPVPQPLPQPQPFPSPSPNPNPNPNPSLPPPLTPSPTPTPIPQPLPVTPPSEPPGKPPVQTKSRDGDCCECPPCPDSKDSRFRLVEQELGQADSGSYVLPPRTAFVSVEITTLSSQVRSQSGNEFGQNIYFLGSYSFGLSSRWGDRNPVSYRKNVFFNSDNGTGFTFQLNYGSIGRVIAYYKQEV